MNIQFNDGRELYKTDFGEFLDQAVYIQKNPPETAEFNKNDLKNTESPIMVMGYPNALAIIGLEHDVKPQIPLIRSTHNISCYVQDGAKTILCDSEQSVVLFDSKNGKYSQLEKPGITDPDEQILFMDGFSTHLLVHTNKNNLFVYDFKDHDWQHMAGVKNILILKSGRLMISYNGRYEVYNKNFLLIF